MSFAGAAPLAAMLTTGAPTIWSDVAGGIGTGGAGGGAGAGAAGRADTAPFFPPDAAGSEPPQVMQKRYPAGFAEPHEVHVGPPLLATGSDAREGDGGAGGLPRVGGGGAGAGAGAGASIGGANENTGASGLDERGFEPIGGGTDAGRSVGRSTFGRPAGGVGGTTRAAFSLRPQSWQNVRLSAFSRPQTSQITVGGDREPSV